MSSVEVTTYPANKVRLFLRSCLRFLRNAFILLFAFLMGVFSAAGAEEIGGEYLHDFLQIFTFWFVVSLFGWFRSLWQGLTKQTFLLILLGYVGIFYLDLKYNLFPWWETSMNTKLLVLTRFAGFWCGDVLGTWARAEIRADQE